MGTSPERGGFSSVTVSLHGDDVERMQRVSRRIAGGDDEIMLHGLELMDLISGHIQAGGKVHLVHGDGNATELQIKLR